MSQVNRDNYNSVLSGRYPSKDMRQIWSDNKKFGLWRRMWTAIAEAQMTLGVERVKPEMVDEMQKHLDDIDYDRAAELEAELRHDVVAHSRTFAEAAPSASDIIHLGCTSCDITDNAELIQMKSAMKVVLSRLATVIHRMALQAQRYTDLPVLGSTHWQPGQPITLGRRICMWMQPLVQELGILQEQTQRLPFRGIKGATGTNDAMLKVFHGTREKVKKLEKMVAEKFGFTNILPITGQTYPRIIDTRILQTLSRIVTELHKISLDLRVLARDKEIEEPFGKKQKGSSAMVHKRNPMRNERNCSLDRHVLSLSLEALLTQALQGLERTLDDSAGRRIYLPEAFLTTDAALLIMQNVFEGLVVYPKVCEKNLREVMPFLICESIITEMTEMGANRAEAYDKLQEHVRETDARIKQEGLDNDLLDRVRSDPYFAPVHDGLDGLMDPLNLIGDAVEQTDEYVVDVLRLLNRFDYNPDTVKLSV